MLGIHKQCNTGRGAIQRRESGATLARAKTCRDECVSQTAQGFMLRARLCVFGGLRGSKRRRPSFAPTRAMEDERGKREGVAARSLFLTFVFDGLRGSK